MRLELAKITIDESIYPRNGVSEFNVGRLVAALNTGAKLPPVIVEAKTLRLVDGRHRYEAHVKKGLKSIAAEQKVYKNEADLFADAVRLNIGHGEPLDNYTVRSAIIRLTEYGYSRLAISECVRLPLEAIEKIERGYASDQTGKPIALKGGLAHLRGTSLTPEQQQVNKHYGGPKATFYVRQLIEMIEHNMHPPTDAFAAEMNRLVDAWRDRTSAKSAA